MTVGSRSSAVPVDVPPHIETTPSTIATRTEVWIFLRWSRRPLMALGNCDLCIKRRFMASVRLYTHDCLQIIPFMLGQLQSLHWIVLQYILSATDDGRLLFYLIERHEESAPSSTSSEVGVSKQQTLRKQHPPAMMAPKHIVELSGSIVALTVGCLGPRQVLVVVVMTCEGDIHLIDVHEDEDIVPFVVNCFETGSVGPSCICIQNHGQLVASFH